MSCRLGFIDSDVFSLLYPQGGLQSMVLERVSLPGVVVMWLPAGAFLSTDPSARKQNRAQREHRVKEQQHSLGERQVKQLSVQRGCTAGSTDVLWGLQTSIHIQDRAATSAK